MKRLWRWITAPALTPPGMLVRAGALAAIYAALTAAGFREAMSVLSHTVPEGMSRDDAGAKAVIYLVSHFAFVLGTPILIIAAGLMAAVERLWKRP